MLKKISIIALVVVLALVAIVYIQYARFSEAQLSELAMGSLIAETPVGPIEYSLVGEAGEPVLLYLHGSPGGYNQAIPSREGYRVLVPSRPGYLRTPISVGASPAEQAAAYTHLLDSLGIDSVIVIGASGGGPSAISFAAQFSDRTNALILIEAVSHSMSLPAMPSLLQNDFSFWAFMKLSERLMGAEAMVKSFVPDSSNSDRIIKDPAKLSKYLTMLWSIWPYSDRAAGLQNDALQFEQLDLATEKISARTLVIHGTADVSVPFDQSKTLAAAITNAAFQPIEGADHMMPLTHEEALETIVKDFLDAGA